MRLASLGLAALLATVSGSASAQTTTTHCTANSNNLNCSSTTSPSAQQQYDQNMRQFQQNMAHLGAAIAQRRAAQATQQAAWNAAATEEARKAAITTRANYEATTAAMERFAADSSKSTVDSVNSDLSFDWSLLNGVESYWVDRGENNIVWHTVSRWGYIQTPAGERVLQNDAVVRTMQKKNHMIDFIRLRRFNPVAGTDIFTIEGRPLYTTVPPSYESRILIGTHAFSARMVARGFEVAVPPGTLDVSLLWTAIAAMPGELPSKFRIWVVNDLGEVLPADLQVLGKKTVKVPVGPANGSKTTIMKYLIYDKRV